MLLGTVKQLSVGNYSQVRTTPGVGSVVRWRRCDLAARIERDLGVKMAAKTVGTLLRRLGFVRLSARPQHPKQDSQALEAHKKNFADLVAGAIPDHARGKPVELSTGQSLKRLVLSYISVPPIKRSGSGSHACTDQVTN